MGKGLLALGASLLEKKEKLFEDLAKLDAKDEQNDEFRMVAEIVQELLAQPSKIRPCRRAVFSNVWDPEQRRLASLKFGATVTYVHRLPKEWVRSTLGRLTALQDDMLKVLERKSKGVLHRLLCRISSLELNTPLPTLDQEAFFEICKQRASASDPPKLKTGGELKVEWARHGWYQLLPVKPDETSAAAHNYTQVSLLNRRFVADLPDYFKVTGSWSVSENHGVRSAYLSPPVTRGAKVRDVKYKLILAFDKDSSVAAWLPEQLKREEKDEGGASEDDAGDDGDQINTELGEAGGAAEPGPSESAASGDVSSAIVAATPTKAKSIVAAAKHARACGDSGRKSPGSASKSQAASTPPPQKRPRLSHAKLKMLLGSS